MTYEETQAVLLVASSKELFKNKGFKSLTEYMKHRKLIRRWCFLNGCRSMDSEQGKHYSKNKLRGMKYDLR